MNQTAWDAIPSFRPPRVIRITHRDSIENKVLEFFRHNPGEELTVSDAVIKYDSKYMHMSKLFRSMFERGLLRRHREGGAGSAWIYGAPAVVVTL